MLFMWSMTAWVFSYVEYLHYMICSCLLLRNFGSGMSWPLGFVVYSIARIKSSLWWVGLCYVGSVYLGMVCGQFGVFGLTFWRSFSYGWRICGSYEAMASYISGLRLVKSFIGVFPRSIPTIVHLPPFEVCSSLCRSRKLMLCRLILGLDVDLHPLRIRVLLIGE